MKWIVFVSAWFLLSAALIQKPSRFYRDTEAGRQAFLNRMKNAVRCSPDLSGINLEDSLSIPLLDGWGHYRMPVTVSNDSASIYFQQGMSLYYGFHIIEALASFIQSTRFDSSFAMGYWGVALSYGPNINDYGYSASPDAMRAMLKAKELSKSNTAVEKALIQAMQVRYTLDTTQSRDKLNQDYAAAMKKVYLDFPGSIDAAVLYVDALMLLHPWDLYTKTYVPQPWTPEIVTVLEKSLAKNPDHPGAAHYYVHAIEASDHPEKALDVANRLVELEPGVAHLVHMPSHIYIRSGYYNLGEKVNDDAVKQYYSYLGRYAPVVNNSSLYLIHNLHMQATCANMEGNFEKSIRSSVDCQKSFDSSWLSLPDFSGIFMQYVYVTPALTYIRFGHWDEMLKFPAVPENYVYGNLLWHYGKGLAYARKGEMNNAVSQLDSVKRMLKEKQLFAPAPSYANPGIAGARVAEKILEGVIAEQNGKLDKSIGFLKEAVILEDSMIYNEPRDWVHPARQYLGRVYLEAGKYSEAILVYNQDLFINPHNRWSLAGLETAYRKTGNAKKAAEIKKEAEQQFNPGDVEITTSVY